IDVHGGVAVAVAPAAPAAPPPTAAPATTPVPAAEEGAADREAQAEAETSHPGAWPAPAIARRRIVVGRIAGIGPRAVGHIGIVGRHVDGIGVGRLDDDRGRRSVRRGGAGWLR